MSDEVMQRDMAALRPVETSPDAALRWEWRTFSKKLGRVVDRISSLIPTGSQDSDEIYFLSPTGENVKVRNDLIDLKVLVETDRSGLEQWAPVMKSGFPLPAFEAQKVVQALRIPVYGLQRESYTLDDALEALDRPEIGLRVVHVHKHRRRYLIEGCTAELSDITVDGIPARTIAVEAEDPEAVRRAVDRLGLTGYANINYPRGLLEIVDQLPERYAVVDVGTNSIKLNVSERYADGGWKTLVDKAALTRLGEGLAQSGRIGETALRRTVEAISAMASEAKKQNVHAIAAVGTAGLRTAENSAEVIAAVEARTGVRIEVLSGEEEARLAYLATTQGFAPSTGSVVVFDTGGGSSQFTFGHGTNVDERFSVDVGAARYTDLFGMDGVVPLDVLDEALQAISGDLASLDGRQSPDALIGMGGAITNLTAVALGLAEYDPDRVHGSVITAQEIDRQIELYRSRVAEARRTIPGLQPDRAPVILAGACIVRTVLQKLGKSALKVSDRGLRHGVLIDRFSPDEGEAEDE
jgi:exopolyphosphatase/guanosine-5'-triphosphate,3'-diphosphate pyrophosphatase